MRKKQAKQNKRRLSFTFWGLLFFLALLVLGGVAMFMQDQEQTLANIVYEEGHLLNSELLSIPENRWVKIYPQTPSLLQSLLSEQAIEPEWNRQEHAGLAFNFKTKSLLIFGSDSHGENWDNQVHEFNLLTMKWVDHYPASLSQSYRSDRNKNRVAGIDGMFPWAMHTYDNVAYIPEMDALMVTSKNNNHTPSPNRQAAEAKYDPSWIYDLISKKWKMLPIKNSPTFFAGASSYDPNTKNLWAYDQWGFWQFDILLQKWRKIPGKHRVGLGMHYTMVTDTKRHQLLFFGNSKKTNNIWAYTPGEFPGQEGNWEIRQVEGDFCPKDQHLPVAYDKHQDAFLLLPDQDEEKSVTLVYLPEENKYVRISGADMPANGMNYMMEYDPFHRVFLLVTGHNEMGLPLRVWAFRLNLQTLNQNTPIV